MTENYRKSGQIIAISAKNPQNGDWVTLEKYLQFTVICPDKWLVKHWVFGNPLVTASYMQRLRCEMVGMDGGACYFVIFCRNLLGSQCSLGILRMLMFYWKSSESFMNIVWGYPPATMPVKLSFVHFDEGPPLWTFTFDFPLLVGRGYPQNIVNDGNGTYPLQVKDL